MTQEQIKEEIHKDYTRVQGRIIFPHEVDGYIGADSVVVKADGLHPFLVLGTHVSSLERPMGDGCWDPCWDVAPFYPKEFRELVKSQFPDSEGELTSPWVYGHSYKEGVGQTERAKLRFSDTFLAADSV